MMDSNRWGRWRNIIGGSGGWILIGGGGGGILIGGGGGRLIGGGGGGILIGGGGGGIPNRWRRWICSWKFYFFYVDGFCQNNRGRV